MSRFCLTLFCFGLLASQVIAGAERCAQRLERQQLNRAATLVNIEQAQR